MALDDLTLDRVRVAGATRSDVETLLADVNSDAVGLFAGEVLVVPSLRLSLPPPGRRRQLAQALTRHMAGLAMGAEQGAPGRSGAGRVLRFRSQAAYWAWLVAQTRRPGHASSPETLAAMPSEVLRDPVVFIRLAVELARLGALRIWLSGLTPRAAAEIEQRMTARFGWQPIPHDATAPGESRTRRTHPADADATGSIADEIRALARTLRAALTGDRPAHMGPSPPLAPAAERIGLAALVTAARPALADRPGLLRSIAEALETQPVAATGAGHADDGRAAPPRSKGGPTPTPSPMSDPRPKPQPAALPDDARRDRKARATARRPATTRPDAIGAEPPPAASPIALRQPVQTDPLAVRRFASGYAGLLFLFNIFTRLELYPDFTQPAGPRLAPSPLWLVDRLARMRFGAHYRSDPLADWIGEQAVPGTLPADWIAKPGWIADFAMGRVGAERRDGRLTLWHRAGFPLADMPLHRARRLPSVLGGRLARHAARETRRHPALPRRDRWLACLLRFLDARIDLATGQCGHGLAALAIPGEIAVDALDLRAGFALDHYPVALRLAGIDRDPGWYPAEGRSVAFSFA